MKEELTAEDKRTSFGPTDDPPTMLLERLSFIPDGNKLLSVVNGETPRGHIAVKYIVERCGLLLLALQ